MEINNTIKDAISNNNLVVFAGSGLSTKFQLPSWKKLVEDIIKELNDKKYIDLLPVMESKLLSPLEVLDKIKDEHLIIRKYIRNHFGIESGDFSLHEKILSISRGVITTNYDDAFEKASFNSIVPTIHTSVLNISEIEKNDKPYIFKLHGSYTESDNCILFKEDYTRLYSKESPSVEKLKSIFAEKVILFIGFSFSDSEINDIFSYLDLVFGNFNQHFILTTEPEKFEKIKFLKPVKIDTYSDIERFVDCCFLCKEQNSVNISPTKKNLNHSKEKTMRIAFLRPDPIDISFSEDLHGIEDSFDSLKMELYVGYLNTKTLELVDDYDMLIIASKVFKSKIYIEEDNLKSSLLSIAEVCDHITNEQIPIVFITDEKISNVPGYNIINISTFRRSTLNRFIYKALRKGDLGFSSDNEITVYQNKIFNFQIDKGKLEKRSFYSNDRTLDIGKKSLTNVVGRKEELSLIATRLLSIIRSNKVLNIKASGGSGKTTLVKKVAYELYNRGYYKEGVFFKSCENVKNYNDFEEVLIDAFGLRDIINFRDYLIENYSLQKLDILIILDNFETVVNAIKKDEFERVIDLIKFATDFANVAFTSRERISGLDDFEDLFSLTPMITDDALELFQKYYGEVKNELEIKILRNEVLEDLLNNNPLAIKLVTKSRTRFKHITELRDQIKENFFESINEDFTLVFKNKADLNIERTKSIYQSINYSYVTLNSKEKIALELLSLFPDGISLSNFKKCFEKNKSSNKISDKELRKLRDKSLIEDYNGTLQLQPIIRRFAEYQFSKRPSDSKQYYCLDAYIFNCHVLDILRFIKNKKSFSDALKFFNLFKNNLINVFTYISDIEISKNGQVPEKKYLLNYIDTIERYVVNGKQIRELCQLMDSVKTFFSDLPYSNTLFDVIKANKQYFFEEFEESYRYLSSLLSVDEMQNRIFEEEEYAETYYKDIISNIHVMEGFTIQQLQMILNNKTSIFDLDHNFFYLGIPNNISRNKIGFYYFEYEAMFNRLSISRLENYIDSLFLEDHLEIMQSTYTLSKSIKLEKRAIQKLVVTNPYTKGLKEIMFAFIEDSNEIKNKHFQNAINDLFHIKYYYLEALYYYCLFLKDFNEEKFHQLLREGIELTKKYYYQYLNHLFNNLLKSENYDYCFSYSFYPQIGLEEFVNKYNLSREKELKEFQLD